MYNIYVYLHTSLPTVVEGKGEIPCFPPHTCVYRL